MQCNAVVYNKLSSRKRQFRTKFAAISVFLLVGTLANLCGCQFPYKIDPSGNCLFVKNDDYKLPEQQSPFVSQPGNRPFETSPSTGTSTGGTSPTVSATTDPAYQSTLPGISAAPGTASGIAPSATSNNTGVIRGASPESASTLLVPGSGPIVLVAPEEQIALIGTEVILFANYKGDDDYLRVGERIEWSLGGVGHIQTTNKTQCSNVLALDFNKDKKLSDRFAVTSTLHYEGTIDRGSADEQGQVPHLAGQSWVSIRSAEEGTSTVTAYAPTIKDWNRRTSSGVVHWIDAEWVYPRADVTKYTEPKVFVTQVKKRSSGAPCPGWVVRYEITGGPNAGLGANRSNSLDVTVDQHGDAAVDLYLLEGNSGTSTLKATIIRPAGVDGGTKQLVLHSSNLTNIWSTESPLRLKTVVPNLRWGERVSGVINVTNSSTVSKSGIISMPLPNYLKLISSEPRPTSQVAQDDGGELVTWHVQDFKGQHTTQIQFVVQAVTDDPDLMSQTLEIKDWNVQLNMFPTRDAQGDTSSDATSGSGNSGWGIGGGQDYGGIGQFPTTPAPDSTGGTQPPFGGSRPGAGMGDPSTQPPNNTGTWGNMGSRPGANVQPNSDPNTFANQIKVECKSGAGMVVGMAYPVEITVTNNANVPFYAGIVNVQLSDNMAFVDGNNQIIRDGENNLIHSQAYYIGTTTEQQITIPPGGQHPMQITVTPIQAGRLTLNVAVMGYAQGSNAPANITGASDSRTLTASLN